MATIFYPFSKIIPIVHLKIVQRYFKILKIQRIIKFSIFEILISTFFLIKSNVIKTFLSMQLTAKLIQKLQLQTGEGKNGPWKKQDIIVETDGQYPKKICVSIWGDKIDETQLQIGNQLSVSFDIESREFNGKWYTDLKAWKIELAGKTTSSEKSSVQNQADFVPEQSNSFSEDITDDLPF